jgi:uncharacterized protein (TIGR02145 family)
MNKIKNYTIILFILLITLFYSCKKSDDVITIKDADGNVYTSVKIGSQYWLKENLKTTKYNDNTEIPLVTDNAVWSTLTTPAYCWYNNDSVTYKAIYGALYNWYAVSALSNAGKNLCPVGWHVATDSQWTTLTDYLSKNGYGYGGNGDYIGKSLAATSGWSVLSTAGLVGNDQASNNKSGFTALPGGSRTSSGGGFYFLGNYATWWTATEEETTSARGIEIGFNMNIVFRNDFSKPIGFSVRCIKD